MDNLFVFINNRRSVLKTLFVREIRESFASRRVWIVMGLCLILIPLGVEVGIRGYKTRLQGYAEASRLYSEEIRTINDVMYKEGARAYAPPSPLSFISLGLELVLPHAAESRYESMKPPAVIRFNNDQGVDNLYEYFFGPIDLVFIVGVVMSLMAVVLTFGSVAGEKEQGTLKQVLSNSVSRANILVAKAAAGGVVLLVPFITSFLLTLTLLSLRGIPPLAEGVSTSIGLAILFSALIIGVFLNLGLLVSVLMKQAVSSLVVLLLAWVFLFGILPRLSSAAAQAVFPAESEAQLDFEKAQVKRDLYRERDAEIERLIQVRRNDLPSSGRPSPTQEEIQNTYRARLEENWRSLEREADAGRKRQASLAAILSRLSPTSCFIRPMSELSRTGWLEYEHFERTARQYEEVLNREIFSKQKWVRTSQGNAGWNEADGNAAAPVFSYHWVPVEAILRAVFPDLLFLVLFNLVLFAGAFLAFLRYDAR